MLGTHRHSASQNKYMEKIFDFWEQKLLINHNTLSSQWKKKSDFEWLVIEGSQPEWCISSMIYSRDISFCTETLVMFFINRLLSFISANTQSNTPRSFQWQTLWTRLLGQLSCLLVPLVELPWVTGGKWYAHGAEQDHLALSIADMRNNTFRSVRLTAGPFSEIAMGHWGKMICSWRRARSLSPFNSGHEEQHF